MRAAILKDRRKLVIRNVPEPVLDKDEVLIKVQYCGICGSDLHVFLEGLRTSLGHEYSGDIVETGKGVEGLEIGDPVVVKPRGCEECYWCKRGEIGLCDKMFQHTTGRNVGAFATYVKAKFDQILKLSDELTHEQGAIIEPTSVALHAVNMSGMKIGDVVRLLDKDRPHLFETCQRSIVQFIRKRNFMEDVAPKRFFHLLGKFIISHGYASFSRILTVT